MKDQFANREYYHIFNRGVDRRKTFMSPQDYERFLFNLYLSNSTESFKIDNLTKYKTGSEKIFSTPLGEKIVAIHAYCLMPNHFHLLVSQRKDNGMSHFMQKLGTAYTMYFNKKHRRSGSLFQGTFKSVHIDSDRQFRYLFSYIHSNAFSTVQKDGSTRIKDMDTVLNYQYSSMQEYLPQMQPLRRTSVLIDVVDFIKDELKNKAAAQKHLQTWLDFHSPQ